MLRALLSFCLLCVGLGFLTDAAALPRVDAAVLEPAVREMCAKKIVFLGEDANHAGAQTIAVKAQLVEMLVQQCGFRGVVFESQFYDMLDFQASLDVGTATEAQLSSAIGLLWSRYAVFQPFERWLFTEATAKRVLVAGVDPQVGGMGARYSPEHLPRALASVLDGDDRRRCEEVMARHNGWAYDDAHPFDSAAFITLEQCARKVDAALSSRTGQTSSRLAAMASSYLPYVGSMDPQGGKPDVRDRAMYRNLTWVMSQWPPGTRVVVWTASVHASKAAIAGKDHGVSPLGSYAHRTMGDDAYSLGFSAAGGTYGSVGGHGAIHELPPPPEGSLETAAFAGHAGQDAVAFLPARALATLPAVPGRAFNYGRFQTRRWADYLDGILVLRTEAAAAALP